MNEVLTLQAIWNGATQDQRREMLKRVGLEGRGVLMAARTWKQLPKDVQKALKKRAPDLL